MYVVHANPRQMMITIKVIKTAPPCVAGWWWLGGDGVPRYNYGHIDSVH